MRSQSERMGRESKDEGGPRIAASAETRG
jgi:hypothetical protein